MNLITRYLDNEQYNKHYESKLEDSNIKANYIIYGDYDNLPKNLTHISQLKKKFPNEIKNYNFGDLIAFSQYRDANTYLIGKDGKLIANPMINDSGYLTVPLEITQYLTDAYSKYEDIEPSEIFLRHDDKFIKDKIGELDNLWNFEYVLLPIDNKLSVKFSNNKCHDFNLSNPFTPEYLYNFYLNSLKEETRLTLKYNLEGNKYDEFIDMYGDLFKKPHIHQFYWTEEYGTSGGGGKNHNCTMKYFGPTEYKEDVIYTLKEFFKGFDYEIK